MVEQKARLPAIFEHIPIVIYDYVIDPAHFEGISFSMTMMSNIRECKDIPVKRFLPGIMFLPVAPLSINFWGTYE